MQMTIYIFYKNTKHFIEIEYFFQLYKTVCFNTTIEQKNLVDHPIYIKYII